MLKYNCVYFFVFLKQHNFLLQQILFFPKARKTKVMFKLCMVIMFCNFHVFHFYYFLLTLTTTRLNSTLKNSNFENEPVVLYLGVISHRKKLLFFFEAHSQKNTNSSKTVSSSSSCWDIIIGLILILVSLQPFVFSSYVMQGNDSLGPHLI